MRVDLTAARRDRLKVIMGSVLHALGLAFGQLADRAVLRVLGKSIAVTIAVFVATGFALYAGLLQMFAWFDWESGGLAEAAASALIAILAFWFLFRLVAVAVLQFFADEIVQAVEARHYANAARNARALTFREDLQNSLKGAGRTVLFNALAAPVALVLLFTAIGPAVVFLLVNAVLLGRELTDMAWLRHRPSPETSSPVGPAQRFALGGAVAGLMLVPFVNILSPVIGAAAGTHLVHLSLGKNHG